MASQLMHYISLLWFELGPWVVGRTVCVVRGQDALECGACLAPVRVPQVVARAVRRPVLPRQAVDESRAGVRQHRVEQAELGQGELTLVRRECEPVK